VAIAVLIVRILIGGLLIVAGVLKAHDGPAVNAAAVAAYRILPPAIVGPLGVALPYFEMLLGGYVVAGLFTRVAAYVAAAQFLLFSAAVASLVVRQIPANCGCFGSGVNTPPTWEHVGADVLLALVTFGVGWFAPGALAVDRWLSGGTAAAQTEGEDL
jgi:uncharacterized membrane protein YphA (DoxX/SURF4 family)